MAKPIIQPVNRGDVLGQGGYDIVTNATVNDHTYVAITAITGTRTSTDLDSGGDAVTQVDMEYGSAYVTITAATSVDTNSWDTIASLEVPEGTTIYGRWSSVQIGANDTAIVYRG